MEPQELVAALRHVARAKQARRRGQRARGNGLAADDYEVAIAEVDAGPAQQVVDHRRVVAFSRHRVVAGAIGHQGSVRLPCFGEDERQRRVVEERQHLGVGVPAILSRHAVEEARVFLSRQDAPNDEQGGGGWPVRVHVHLVGDECAKMSPPMTATTSPCGSPSTDDKAKPAPP